MPTPTVRVVECDDHVGQHVFREPEGGEESCTNPVDFPDFEHACTDLWSVGWYVCTCGEPWLTTANRCMTQPPLRPADTPVNLYYPHGRVKR